MVSWPGRKVPATSTPRRAHPAWRLTAPRARCTPPTTARSTRSSASRTARLWTSEPFNPPRAMRAVTRTRRRRTRSAPTRFAGSRRSTTSPARANHLIQPPRGGFSGPALGGFNNLPIADMAPVTLNGHKVYGVFIAPGMGLRQNDAKGTAVDDQAEGQYWVINGHHYNGGCCFDYRQRRDRQPRRWRRHHGNHVLRQRHSLVSRPAPGAWIMSDQENNLVVVSTNLPMTSSAPIFRASPGGL